MGDLGEHLYTKITISAFRISTVRLPFGSELPGSQSENGKTYESMNRARVSHPKLKSTPVDKMKLSFSFHWWLTEVSLETSKYVGLLSNG